MDIGITIGYMFTLGGGPGAFWGRVAWHVVNAVIYIPAYAGVLLALRRQSTVGTGAAFGVVLWLAGPMTLVPVLLDLQSAVRAGGLTNPGVFMLALGLGSAPACVDLVAHLTHGILVGVIYKHRCG
jgi:hypothetical protein